MTDTDQRFIGLLEESAKREQQLKHKLLEARWSQESTAAKAANLEVKLKESQRENAALMHIAAAAKALVDYDIDGEALNWPESNQKFENLKAAVEARKEQP